MFRHSDVFQMGALTFATATMSSNRTEAILNPTGMLFKMYRDHFGVIPVEVTGDSPQPKPTFPAGGDQPAVNPGSDTYPLDVSAALSEDRKTLSIAVLNPSDAEQSITDRINGTKLAMRGSCGAWLPIPSMQRCRWTRSRKSRWRNRRLALCPTPLPCARLA
jgi:alpha-N-arabinofuranosidase